MENKRLFFVVAINLFLTGKVLLSQNYVPFGDSSFIWTVGLNNYNIKGDSIYKGKQYKKFYSGNGTIFEGLVRQNVTLKRVYGIPKIHTTESLLYDFNLNVTDQITVTDMLFFNPNQLIVIDKDSILLQNALYRKRIKLYSPNTGNVEYWIEGIGSSYGPLNSGLADFRIFDVDYCYPVLLCQSQNSVILYLNPKYNVCYYNTDVECITGISKHNSYSQVKVSPNPVKDIITISFVQSTNKNNSIELKFTDVYGREVKKITILQNQQIDLKELSKGIYFLQVFGEGRLIANKKIIME